MATGASPDGLLRGRIAASDTPKESRPYHRNCSCALHDKRGCSPASSCRRNLSYPLRRAWSGSRLLAAAAGSAPATPSPTADAERKGIARSRSQADGLGDLDL